MLRLVIFLVGIAVVASGLSWLADRPGSLVINWQGYEIETSVFRAVVMLALVVGLSVLLWSLITALWRSPASVGQFFNRRRQMRGLEALSGGMIAIGAGDRANATRFAVQARKALPNEPLTHLLRAQAAQLTGDRATARRMYEAMLTQPETEQLGLRGLFLEAEREGEGEAARQFAERSIELNPKLGWAVDALFELQCKEKDWAGALKTLTVAKHHQHHDKATLDRRRAVLMTARAMALEEADPNRALNLAVDAHHLAHALVPAAALAGRMLAARGHTKRAAKIIERTWRLHPHPDLALVYAHARIGDSPRDRLDRIKRLAQLNPHSLETPVAIAGAAIEAKDWRTARGVLEQLDPARITQRVCMLMARIEGEEAGDKGRVREWLARTVHAPRDPAWVADGVVSDKWAPVSPRTGAFDAFEWRVPADVLDGADTELLAAKLDELVKLGAPVPVEAAAGLAHEDEHEGHGGRDVRDAGAGAGAPAAIASVAAPRGSHSQEYRSRPDRGGGQDDRRSGRPDRPDRDAARRGPAPPSREAEDAIPVTASQRGGPTPRPVRAGQDGRPGQAGAGWAGSLGVVKGPAPARGQDEARDAAGKAGGGAAAVSALPAAARNGGSSGADKTGADKMAADRTETDRRALEPSAFIAPRSDEAAQVSEPQGSVPGPIPRAGEAGESKPRAAAGKR